MGTGRGGGGSSVCKSTTWVCQQPSYIEGGASLPQIQGPPTVGPEQVASTLLRALEWHSRQNSKHLHVATRGG